MTNDNSIVFANMAKTMEAVDCVKDPPECITLPYRGCIRASNNHMPEKTDEYTESIKIEMDTQLVRFLCISCFAGHPSIKSVESQQ